MRIDPVVWVRARLGSGAEGGGRGCRVAPDGFFWWGTRVEGRGADPARTISSLARLAMIVFLLLSRMSTLSRLAGAQWLGQVQRLVIVVATTTAVDGGLLLEETSDHAGCCQASRRPGAARFCWRGRRGEGRWLRGGWGWWADKNLREAARGTGGEGEEGARQCGETRYGARPCPPASSSRELGRRASTVR